MTADGYMPTESTNGTINCLLDQVQTTPVTKIEFHVHYITVHLGDNRITVLVCIYTLYMSCSQQVIEAMHEERHDVIVQPPPPGCPRAIYSIMVDCWLVHRVGGPNKLCAGSLKH